MRGWSVLTLFLLAGLTGPVAASVDRDAAGYAALAARLGEAMPTGAGVVFMMVEASEIGGDGPYRYLPNPAAAALAGKTFTDVTDNSTPESSSHATFVASFAVGLTDSMAPGTTDIRVWHADDWLRTGFLRLGAFASPRVAPGPVFSHAWISTSSAPTDHTQILRRLDFASNRDGFLAVAGLNNGSSTTIPELLAPAYHGLSVGLTSGAHSRGTTTIDGTGRVKPELVAPATLTSWATGLVSGAVAMLWDGAGDLGEADAQRPETLKAAIMAGASKAPFAGWARTEARPLDSVFGAGQLDVDATWRILEGGRQPVTANGVASAHGWDRFTLASNSSRSWDLEVPAGEVGLELSAVVTWHRVILILGTNVTSGMANVSLELHGVAEGGGLTLLDRSDSAVDNVEHIWRPGPLAPGRYRLTVARPSSSTGAVPSVAWRMATRRAATFVDWAVLTGLGAAADPAGDADGDGWSNRLEYALGRDPLVGGPGGATAGWGVQVVAGPEPGEKTLEVTYQRRRLATDLTYTVESSADLTGPWAPGVGSEISVTPIDADLETVVWRSTVPISDGSQWLRLRVGD